MQYHSSKYQLWRVQTARRLLHLVSLLSTVAVVIATERFSIDCRKTKTKAITPTNHNGNKQLHEPITIPSNYL